MTTSPTLSADLPPFDRSAFLDGETMMRIGDGAIGGKAGGLVRARRTLDRAFPRDLPHDMTVNIPSFVVLTTEVFEKFMERNRLHELPFDELPDDRIANAFQHADLPTEFLGDLRAFINTVKQPLAIRSSSVLEDALDRPFAGVYETKMTPNNQPDSGDRFVKFVQAIKFVYATTFFKRARDYIRLADPDSSGDRMAVMLQEIVGRRFNSRFYPDVSGVGRSYNFYPGPRSKPEEGVVSLALGLGKTIVDGGLAWSYSPVRPKAPPPFGSAREVMNNTQRRFWAVNMGRPPAFDPIRETEFLIECDLSEADYDGALEHAASTYIADSDRIVPGVGRAGPRIVDFAPLLQFNEFGFNDVARRTLQACEEDEGAAIEIEFVAAFPDRQRREPARFGLVQVRPMATPEERVVVEDADMRRDEALVVSTRALGNGAFETVRDIVYVRPDRFEAKHTRAISNEVERFNTSLLQKGRPYVLIGFGRWGSSDPWLGIPIVWSQIGGAKVVVEATLPNMNVEPSQGAHLFHNISSFRVCYFTVSHRQPRGIDWSWLGERPADAETDFIRHVRLDQPLSIRVDGRSGRGVITRPPANRTPSSNSGD